MDSTMRPIPTARRSRLAALMALALLLLLAACSRAAHDALSERRLCNQLAFLQVRRQHVAAHAGAAHVQDTDLAAVVRQCARHAGAISHAEHDERVVQVLR